MRFTYNSTSFYDAYVNCSIRVKNLGAEIEKFFTNSTDFRPNNAVTYAYAYDLCK